MRMVSEADIRSTAQQVHVEAVGRAAVDPAAAQGAVELAKANLRTLRLVSDEETRGFIDGLTEDLDRVLAGHPSALAFQVAPPEPPAVTYTAAPLTPPGAGFPVAMPEAPAAFPIATPLPPAGAHPVLPATRKSRRGLWIGAGALVVIIAAGAAAAAKRQEAGTAAIGVQVSSSSSSAPTTRVRV
jgi:hypothetical protein